MKLKPTPQEVFEINKGEQEQEIEWQIQEKEGPKLIGEWQEAAWKFVEEGLCKRCWKPNEECDCETIKEIQEKMERLVIEDNRPTEKCKICRKWDKLNYKGRCEGCNTNEYYEYNKRKKEICIEIENQESKEWNYLLTSKEQERLQRKIRNKRFIYKQKEAGYRSQIRSIVKKFFREIDYYQSNSKTFIPTQ